MAMFGYGVVGTQKLGVKRSHDGVIYEGEWKRFTRNLINDVAKVFRTRTWDLLSELKKSLWKVLAVSPT